MTKAIIKTADNMSDETYLTLVNGIKNKFGEDIEFEKETDNSVLGGFILYLNGVAYDFSVSTQLNRLKKHISE
ncbi:MAG: F0F1 ATP synthase subunit delta [Acutalibacteraceae bacterium]